MGRGRVELKRIENKTRRQVSFSKRRSGLFKKAHEISLLCDAQLALIVFSANAKLFHYNSSHHSNGMESILERYERCSYPNTQVPDDSQQRNRSLECTKLMARVEALERNLRNFAGEDLDDMSSRELQHLEQQIEAALKRIQSAKVKQVKQNEKILVGDQHHNLGSKTLPILLLPSPTIGGGDLQTREFMKENENDEPNRKQTTVDGDASPCQLINKHDWICL